ncbi:MAG TPA: hypothetical protein PLB12_12065, partial [Candidatus Goldiibacteriota bacterium]|nr:hypothetical protein [Candidatus Goldiibacteriota bacterium]
MTFKEEDIYISEGQKKRESGSVFELHNLLAFYMALGACFVLCVLIYYISPHIFVKSHPAAYGVILHQLMGWVRPEDGERLMYVAALITFPVIFVWARYFMYSGKTDLINKYKFLPVLFNVLNAVAVVLIIWLGREKGYIYISDSVIFKNTLLFVFFYVLVIFLLGSGISGRTRAAAGRFKLHIVYLFFDAVIFYIIYRVYFISPVTLEALPSFDLHFDAVFYSMSQVFAGRVLLLDLPAQYGLYADFLKPLFAITGGLSVFRFTEVMGLLTAFSFLLLYFFLRANIKNRVVLFMGFISMMFLSYLMSRLFVYDDFYFQYYPLRVIGPSIMIFIAGLYFRFRLKWLYYASMIVSSLFVLWNPDTGIVLYLTWMLVLMYIGIEECNPENFIRGGFVNAKKVLKPLLDGFLILALIIFTYCICFFIRGGRISDLIDFLQYQKIFYGFGFYMLPMPVFHPWNIYAIIVAVGLMLSLSYLFSKEKTKELNVRNAAIFMVSILSAGLFSYYQGRSHDVLFFSLIYLPVINLMLFADSMYEKFKREPGILKTHPGSAAIFLIIIAFFLSVTITFFVNGTLKKTEDLAKIHMNKENSTVLTERLDFVKNVTREGEGILILSPSTAVLYAESKTYNPLRVPGIVELLLIKDLAKIVDYIAEKSPGRKIIADTGWMKRMDITVPDYYQIAGASPSGDFILYQQGSVIAGVTPKISDLNSIFHCIRVGEGVYKQIKNSSPVGNSFASDTLIKTVLSGQFSMHVLVTPVDKIARFAEIAGDMDDKGGFSLRVNNRRQDEISVIIMTDEGLYTSKIIKLKSDKLNLLSANYAAGRLKVYVDGNIVVNDKVAGNYIE